MISDDKPIETAGFTLPPRVWEKPDPRGKEYGAFRAKFTPNNGEIVVYHSGDDYEMNFKTEGSFLNWAKACT